MSLFGRLKITQNNLYLYAHPFQDILLLFIKLEGVDHMKNISNDLLIDTYFQAIKLNLHPDFIRLLETEICRRSLQHKIKISS